MGDNVVRGAAGTRTRRDDKVALFSPLSAANKLPCFFRRQFKPAPGQDISPEQQLTMSLFIDISGALAQALTSLGTLKEMTGSPREAMILYQGALPQCEVMNDTGAAFTCRVGIGNCHRALSEFERAIQILKLELETARVQRDEVGEAICCNSLSRCYTSLPFDRAKYKLNVAAATEFAGRDVQLSEADGDWYPAQLGSARAQLASCLRKGGEIAKAAEVYKVAIEGLCVGGDLGTELMTRLELAEMLLCEGRGAEEGEGMPDFLAEAYGQGVKALELSERLKDKSNALNALEMMSRSGKGNKEDSEKLEAALIEVQGGKHEKVRTLGVLCGARCFPRAKPNPANSSIVFSGLRTVRQGAILVRNGCGRR